MLKPGFGIIKVFKVKLGPKKKKGSSNSLKLNLTSFKELPDCKKPQNIKWYGCKNWTRQSVFNIRELIFFHCSQNVQVYKIRQFLVIHAASEDIHELVNCAVFEDLELFTQTFRIVLVLRFNEFLVLADILFNLLQIFVIHFYAAVAHFVCIF